MKKILIAEIVSGILFILLIILGILLASCEQRKYSIETNAGRQEIRLTKDLWIYAGSIRPDCSPLTNTQGMEKNIWSLCYSNIFYEVKERMIPSHVKQFVKNDTSFHYSVQKNEQENRTYLTISINPALRTSSGSAVTADDLIFNYYLRCIPSPEMEDTWESGIDGASAYYYGKKNISSRQKEIRKCLEKPRNSLAEDIREKIIKPELEKEYEWVESLFSNEENEKYTNGYTNAESLFSHYYAYKTDYQAKNMQKDTIIKEIALQYGTNYQALEKVTGKDYSNIAEKFALLDLLKDEKKDKIKTIKGIQKLDERTIRITLLGLNPDLKKYMDFWLLPVTGYGEQGENGHKIPVIKKSTFSNIIENTKKSYQGSGGFYCSSFDDSQLIFEKNKYGYEEKTKVNRLVVVCGKSYTSKEIMGQMLNRKLDLAVFPIDDKTEIMVKDRGTGAASRLYLLKMTSENGYGILYRSDYINATTLPTAPETIQQVFRQMKHVSVNV